jgi:hypothetical protein
MKISELIGKLLDMQEKHGDIDVYFWDEYDGIPVEDVKIWPPTKPDKGKTPKPKRVVVE